MKQREARVEQGARYVLPSRSVVQVERLLQGDERVDCRYVGPGGELSRRGSPLAGDVTLTRRFLQKFAQQVRR